MLELKACKISGEIKIRRVALGSISEENVNAILEKARSKGEWVVFENIKYVKENDLSKIVKSIMNSLRGSGSRHENYRVWLTY